MKYPVIGGFGRSDRAKCCFPEVDIPMRILSLISIARICRRWAMGKSARAFSGASSSASSAKTRHRARRAMHAEKQCIAFEARRDSFKINHTTVPARERMPRHTGVSWKCSRSNMNCASTTLITPPSCANRSRHLGVMRSGFLLIGREKYDDWLLIRALGESLDPRHFSSSS